MLAVAAWQFLRIPELTAGALTEGVPSQFAAFLLGILITAASGALARLPIWGKWPVAVVAVAGSILSLTGAPSSLPGIAGSAASLGILAATGMAWAVVLLRVFSGHFDRPSIIVDWVVAASLPVYLLHHVVVLAAGPTVAAWGLEPLAGWAILTVIAVVASFAGYELANLTRVGRLLTTGNTDRGVSITDITSARYHASSASTTKP